MKTEAFNNEILISAYTSDEEREIISLLSYTDKSKEFQARKMENNRFIPRHLVEKVKQEAHGNLIKYRDDKIVVPPGFIDEFKIDVDNRVDTGAMISLPWAIEPPKPRPYQEDAIELMLNNKRGVINMGTGLGKTLTTIHFLRKFKRKALIICPSSSIANGFYEELCKAFGKNRIGYMGGGKKKVGDITVGLAQTIVKNTEMLKDLGVIVTDECFPAGTCIATDIGPINIRTLYEKWRKNEQLPLIRSFNETTKEFEYKKMTYAWSKKRDDLVHIKYSKRAFSCTPNHKILTSEGWKEAGTIKPGDLLIGEPSNKTEHHVIAGFNDDQKDFIVGSFLGDGHIAHVGLNRYRLCFTHGMKQAEYAKWKAELINGNWRDIKNNGYRKKDAIRVTSNSFDLLETLPHSKTYCPDWIIDSINAKSLAIWFMDDGSMNKKGNHAKIATCSFDEISVRKLADKLITMGIQCKAKFRKYTGVRAPGYWNITINKVGCDALIKIIKPYVHPSMAYKVIHQDCGDYIWSNKRLPYGYGLVDSVNHIKNKNTNVYDIEVEDNHNFIVCGPTTLSGIVAHNCHHLPAVTFYEIADKLSHVGRMFGLSATAFRSDGKDVFIKAAIGNTLIQLDAAWGIENGWLAFPHFIIRKVNTIGPSYKGDKLKNYKKHVLESKEMTEVICKDINWAVGKQQSVLVLVSEIAHGELLAKATGLPLATGENKESKNLIEALNDGKIPGLIATASLVGEGCDTRRVDVLVLANFAGSAGPVTQNVGRGLRKYPGKEEVIVFDYMPNNPMLARHCNTRIKVFKTLSQEIRIV